MKNAPKKYSVGFRVWINEEQSHFMGLGRVRLLENIIKTGSITQAAAAMKMSYRQAWQMVQDMNGAADKPLVEKTLGGKGGGGATVTDAGERAIKAYYRIEKDVSKLAEKLSGTLKL